MTRIKLEQWEKQAIKESAGVTPDGINLLLHILRNPYGYSKTERKKARLEAADLLERLALAALSGRQFDRNIITKG